MGDGYPSTLGACAHRETGEEPLRRLWRTLGIGRMFFTRKIWRDKDAGFIASFREDIEGQVGHLPDVDPVELLGHLCRPNCHCFLKRNMHSD